MAGGMENMVKIYTTSLSHSGGLVMSGSLSIRRLVKKVSTHGFVSFFGYCSQDSGLSIRCFHTGWGVWVMLHRGCRRV